MALIFDGFGHIALAQEWHPSDASNFEVELEYSFPGNQGWNTYSSFLGSNDRKGALQLGNDKFDFYYEKSAGGVKFLRTSGSSPYAQLSKIRIKAVSATEFEVYWGDEVTPSETLTADAADAIVNFGIESIGYRNSSIPQLFPAGAELHQVKLTDLANPANSSIYNFDNGSGTTLTDSGPLANHGTLIDFSDLNAAWGIQGPSITAASNITDETQPATITLANNENAPTAIQINGEAGSNIAFVSEDTEAGTETYSYLPPLIADDAEAELSVTVDGDTLSTTISYANSYDRDQLTHPATEAEYSTNSLSYPNAYGTSLPYEWKVITDASAAVVVIDWDALEADDGFFKDIAGYATPVANGSTTVTLGVFVPETGEAYLFDRTINVSDGSVVVEGQGLWRELFRDPTEELFTELFR